MRRIVGVLSAVAVVARLAVTGDPFAAVWAEDGLFWSEAHSEGVRTVVAPYAGYLHVPARFLVWLGSHLPFDYYPIFTVVLSAILTGALAVFVFSSSIRVVPLPWALLAALSLPLAPAFAGEIGALANLQWLLVPATFWALWRPWAGRLGVASQFVAAVTGLSAILAVSLLPVGLVRKSWHATIALAGGLLLQVAAAAVAPGGRAWSIPPHPAATALGLFGGDSGQHPRWPSVAFGAALALAVTALILSARRKEPLIPLLCALPFITVVPVVNGGVAGRYVAAATMLIASAIALARPTPKALVWPASVLVLLAVVVGFAAPDIRVGHPAWTCEDGVAPLAPDGWGEVRC